jgi:hypothetical protein
MRTVMRFGVLVLLIGAVLAGWWFRSAGAGTTLRIRSSVEVSSAMQEQLELARWAVERFEAAGLEPPAVQIEFHDDPSGCGGHMGYAMAGRVDVCTVLVNEMARRNLLHEMAHVWIDQKVSRAVRERFLELRGLQTWNASSDPWDERGYEQGAEIMSWALGTRILTAQIPDNDPRSIAIAYELLTGTPLHPPAV